MFQMPMSSFRGGEARWGRILTLPPTPEGLHNFSPGSRSAPRVKGPPTRSANPGGVEPAEPGRQMVVVIPLPSSPRHRHRFRRPFGSDSSSLHGVPVVIRNPAHLSLFNPSGVGGNFSALVPGLLRTPG